jgi:PD-(D/E)XK nuclease superfamily
MRRKNTEGRIEQTGLHKEVYAVVGCAIEVLNVRGHGLHEKIYESSLRGVSIARYFLQPNRNDMAVV